MNQCFGSILEVVGRAASVTAVCGALCLAASSGQAQSVPLVTNRFDSGLETFNYQQNLTADGNSIGWSATANAGGSSGEVGGTFARNDHNNAPFVGDVRSLVVPLSLNHSLSFSGKVVLTDVSSDGSVGACFFDTNTFGTTNFTFLALRFVEPTSPGGPFRATLRSFGPGPGSGAGSPIINVPQGVPASFQVTWQPSSVYNSGMGTLTVVTPTSTNTVTHSYTAAVTFNAFGVGGLVHEQGTPADPTKTCIAYFDDLVYSVPPSGPPQILKQPTAPAVLYVDSTFTMFAVVGGDAPIDYQWWKISGGITNMLAGATNQAFIFDPVGLSDAGTYFLVASNGYNGGSVTNSALVTIDVQELPITPSFAESGGKVVIDAEHPDRNWVVNNSAWLFDTNWPGYAGNGYLVSVTASAQARNWVNNAHADYYVHFSTPGTWYVWLRGADVGNRAASLGVNGVAPTTARNIGNSAGAFGSAFSGTWTWCGFYGGNPASIASIDIAAAGDYVLSLFMVNQNLLVDQIFLTQDVNYIPGGAETETRASTPLGVRIATPSDGLLVTESALASGQTLRGKAANLVAASVTQGLNPIAKVEFYAGLEGGASNKIGEATSFPWQILWTSYAVGTNVLTAIVTDSGSATATSANVVKAVATDNYVAPLVPPLYTNDFTAGLKTFMTAIRTNDRGASFGWNNTAYAGGSAGEVGGLFLRSANTASEFLGVVFDSSLRWTFDVDGLIAAGSVVVTNGSPVWDGQFNVVGYATINDPVTGLPFTDRWSPFSLLEGGASGFPLRARVGAVTSLDAPAPFDVPFTFEVYWQPSPIGSGYMSRLTLSCPGAAWPFATRLHVISSQAISLIRDIAPNAAGFGSWETGSGASGLQQIFVNADDLTYYVPVPKLSPSLSGDQITLKWHSSVPAYNLWCAPSLEGTAVWTQEGLPSPSFEHSTGAFSITQPADQPSRFFRLQY